MITDSIYATQDLSQCNLENMKHKGVRSQQLSFNTLMYFDVVRNSIRLSEIGGEDSQLMPWALRERK